MGLFHWLRRILGRAPEPPIAEAPPAEGWDAISGALARIYGDQEPKHWGTYVSWAFGGPDPLDGISAWEAGGERPHWHYVSYGMSDLYEKTVPDAAVSGFGFEFTFRLARNSDEPDAPIWPATLLQNLARYVFDTGNAFEPGHHMAANGPISESAKTALVAFLFVTDPQLPSVDTPHGTLAFLQVIGITEDEYNACRSWNAESFADVLRRRNPLLVTDLNRRSILSDPAIAAEVTAGRQRDGSSSSGSRHEELTWTRRGDEFVITMTSSMFAALPLYLEGRLSHGRSFTISGAERAVQFTPDSETRGVENGELLVLSLSDRHVEELTRLASASGSHRLTGTTISFEVRPSVIA